MFRLGRCARGCRRAELACGLKVPSSQATHCWLRVRFPAVRTYCPAEHSVQAAQLAAFSLVLKVPSVQSLQARFVVAFPFVLTYCPASQDAQLVQLAAFSLVLKLPSAQGVQSRSAWSVGVLADVGSGLAGAPRLALRCIRYQTKGSFRTDRTTPVFRPVPGRQDIVPCGTLGPCGAACGVGAAAEGSFRAVAAGAVHGGATLRADVLPGFTRRPVGATRGVLPSR